MNPETTDGMAGSSPLGPVAPLHGLVRMTPLRAQRGYRLTCFLTSMRQPAMRQAFEADPQGCMALAEKLGSLVGQLAHGGLSSISIEV